MLRKSEELQLGEKKITIRELTVDELDGVLGALDTTRKPHWAEVLFESPVPVEVVVITTGIAKEELGKYTPSELYQLWVAVARVNDFLFKGLQRLAVVSEKIAAASESASGDSLPS